MSRLVVAQGEILTIIVGGGGKVGTPGCVPPNYPGEGGWPNGGAGGNACAHPGGGGGGGGSSVVLKNGAVVLEAAGGGGGFICQESSVKTPGGPGLGEIGACSTGGQQPGTTATWGGCGAGGGGGGFCGGPVNTGGTSHGTTVTPGSGSSAGNGAAPPCSGTCGKGGESGSDGVVAFECG